MIYIARANIERSGFITDNTCIACDLLHLLFLIDDYTDEMDVTDVRAVCDASWSAMLNPNIPRPKGETIMGEVRQQ